MQIKDLLTEKRLRHLEEMVSEIAVRELSTKISAKEIFKLVEVSNPNDFTDGHIEGALNVPLHSLETEISRKFKKFQQIVIYAQEASSSVGTVAVRKLQRLGFSNVLLLRGGKEAWRSEDLPLVGREEEPEDETEKDSTDTWLK